MSDLDRESLELKIAYLERAHQELSDVVYAQRLELDNLNARLLALVNRVADSESGQQSLDPESERPPHY